MRSALGLLAVAAVACAYAWPLQATGDNQNAHYALVKALSRGTPYIDETLGETGDLRSHDVARSDGHLYAVKAPGLALAAVPGYEVVRATGMRTTGDPMHALWVLNLLTSVLATAVLLLLVRDLARELAPGYGSATAVIVGLGALTLPFATLFFAHALGTALIFGAFWALWRSRPWLAGLLAGLAIVVEFPTVWIAAILAVYCAVGGPAVRRLGAFAAGGFAGVLPLLAFNAWAYRNPFHTPYSDYWKDKPDFSPVALPSGTELSRELFSSLGLATLAPVLAAGIAGMVLLYRSGQRAEALVCAAVPLLLVVYFSGSNAFGGLGPPRYLTPMMPFALLPAAAALRRWPLTTLTLAAITSFQAVVMTATGPLAAYDGGWLERAGDRLFVSTAASLVGVTGWYAIAPFFLAAGAAAGLAVASLPRIAVTTADAALAVGAACSWGIAALASYNDFGRTPGAPYVLTVVLAVALVAGASLAVPRPAAQAVPR